jgi:hypothetical protein
MSLKTLIRPDVVTYVIAIVFLVFSWQMRHQAIDVQLHDTYYVIAYQSFSFPVFTLLMVMALIYTVLISARRLPSRFFSWGFIICMLISIVGLWRVLISLFAPYPSHYYTWTQFDESIFTKAVIYMIFGMIGIAFYIMSLVRATKR